MSLETFQSPNFQLQFENTQFSAAELTALRARTLALLVGFESDYATLSNWFGVAVGEGFGANNRVFVTLNKTIRGASNNGYNSSNPQITANVNGNNDSVLSLFVAEMSEVLMSYKGKWGETDSGGEGLSRVCSDLLHPNSAPAGGNVNAWLASDPTQDLTSAVADTEFRKDWVNENFKGGPLKAGNSVPGDQDSYSFGCSILFIFYLKDQLGFSMPQIIQNGGATLAETYRNLTGKNDDPFWDFKSLLSDNFPLGVKSNTDNPFPLTRKQPATKVAAGLGASDNISALVFTKPDNRIFYSWWKLGEGGNVFGEMDGDGRTDAAPAAALVGNKNNFLFAVVKGVDNSLYLNQGQLGRSFVGWQGLNFQSNLSPGAASSGNNSAIIGVSPDGSIFYTWWKLGEAGKAFVELDGGGRTDTAPAASLVGKNHDYLFTFAKGLDGNLCVNQGKLGAQMVGWQLVNFQTKLAPGAAGSGNISVVVAVGLDGRIFYSWWELGKAGSPFVELDGGGRTDAAPTASLVGKNHNFLFVVIKGLDGLLYINQGELGKPFVGWQQLV